MVYQEISGVVAGGEGRAAGGARSARTCLLQSSRVPRGDVAAGRTPGRALRAASGRGHVARAQRVRGATRRVLLPVVGTGLPRVAAGPLREPRRAQPRLGDRVLGAALRVV